MNMFEAIMECQRRLGKSAEFQADTLAKMEATPGMVANLKSQAIAPGQEEQVITWLTDEAKALEARPARLKALQLLNQALLSRQELENN